MPYRQQRPRCPACSAGLEAAKSGEVPYAHCPSCRGVWLSVAGLEILLSGRQAKHAAQIVTLLDAGFAHATSRACVGCGKPLVARKIIDVNVDYCGGCKGIFLDEGEFDEVLLADAGFDPKEGMPSDAERARRMLDAAINRWSRHDILGR